MQCIRVPAGTPVYTVGTPVYFSPCECTSFLGMHVKTLIYILLARASCCRPDYRPQVRECSAFVYLRVHRFTLWVHQCYFSFVNARCFFRMHVNLLQFTLATIAVRFYIVIGSLARFCTGTCFPVTVRLSAVRGLHFVCVLVSVSACVKALAFSVCFSSSSPC